MNREDYAKKINWKGTATRMISLNEIPKFEKGEKINPGLCWTDGGVFHIESQGEYDVLFAITEEVEGHKVDYDNEEECEDLGCEDCWAEEEIIIDRVFEVVDFWEYDSETGFAKVFLK